MSGKGVNLDEQRYTSETRHFGGLIFVLGITSSYAALAEIASRFGTEDTTATDGVPLASLISHVAMALFGTAAIFTGYLQVIHDYGGRALTGFLILAVQLAWMPFITNMVDVGKQARTGDAFIPSALNPSEGDVKYVGAMGICGILSYGIAFFGSLAFMCFALYAYQAGKGSLRDSAYFRGHYGFYCGILLLAGLSQLAIGTHALSQFGSGPLEAPINVAMYTINFPEIAILTGIVQICVAVFGLLRWLGIAVGGARDHSFQIASLVMWLCMLILQLMVQVAYVPGPDMAAAAPTRACLYLSMAFMPAYLDFKMRNTLDVQPSFEETEGTEYGEERRKFASEGMHGPM